jgi:hypothetical protein
MLHGIAQTFLDQTGESWQAPEEDYRRTSIDSVGAHLGADQHRHIYSTGKSLRVEEAVSRVMAMIDAAEPAS